MQTCGAVKQIALHFFGLKIRRHLLDRSSTMHNALCSSVKTMPAQNFPFIHVWMPSAYAFISTPARFISSNKSSIYIKRSVGDKGDPRGRPHSGEHHLSESPTYIVAMTWNSLSKKIRYASIFFRIVFARSPLRHTELQVAWVFGAKTWTWSLVQKAEVMASINLQQAPWACRSGWKPPCLLPSQPLKHVFTI